ncbi:hypothetical protein [Sebaldella sp. S0638]|uniref:hypothetical protein n=1 Tax=Sebaldella sp. S0638 TaxID=2957809 RepID=UPI00209DA863|nr:hypothetical protein [Sebaldella sp. S0638]MCP1224526.1 hypothetical protein [Sebaldella sp. S0638]
MTKLKSGDILKPSKFGMMFPAGILSMTAFAMWFLLLMVPVIGLINKPDIVIRDVKNAAPELWLTIGGTLILIILLQILFRMVIKRKRIIIDESYVYVKSIFTSKEVEIVNVKTINKTADRAALCTNITLVYRNRSRANISGWLMKWGEMDRLADYIYSKNSN